VEARDRTILGIAGALLLAGCSPVPGEVMTSGSSDGSANSTVGPSTDGPGPTTGGPVTVASMDGSAEGPTTTPLDGSTTATGGTTSTNGSTGESTTDEPPGDCHPLLVEVFYDGMGGNNEKQWIELYNPCGVEITLTNAYSLGWGGNDYTTGTLSLVGMLGDGGCFVVGGPQANNENGNPVFDQVANFSRDLELSGNQADGVALFLGVAEDIAVDTVPVDAVIYGTNNSSGLLDSEGETPEPHVGDAPQLQSIRRTAPEPEWIVESDPMPNDCPPF
jgi:hypothetical protein